MWSNNPVHSRIELMLCHCALLLCQVYTIVTTALEGSSPPGRTAVCELLEKLQEPVPYLQMLFQPISSRVSQVNHTTAAAPRGPSDPGWGRVIVRGCWPIQGTKGSGGGTAQHPWADSPGEV